MFYEVALINDEKVYSHDVLREGKKAQDENDSS